jgi:AraC-like DNA-binding protein
MSSLLDAVRRHAESHADGMVETAIPGLFTVRATAVSGLLHDISRPLACLVVQGDKQVTMGSETYAFSADDSLLVTADVPTVSQITRATLAQPYLSLVLELDAAILAELAQRMGDTRAEQPTSLRVEPTEAETADAALRLLQLLDRPAALPVLRDQLVREMHYWLLAGRLGPSIRRLGVADGHLARVARAVALLRADFAAPLPVERLAAEAGMSPSSFHQHFRAATSLSPLQFQKQLRLIEARRLMLAGGMGASHAAYAVGYESVPQFTREYGRLFGMPPVREIAAARGRAA